MTLPTAAPHRPPEPRRGDDLPAVYGMVRPDLGTARTAVEHAAGQDPEAAAAAWAGVLELAGLTGSETGAGALETVVDVLLRHPDPVLVLCGRALRIRLSAYTHLLAARRKIREEKA